MKEQFNFFAGFKTVIICLMIVSLATTAQAQTSTAGQPSDAEWQLMLDRVNLLVDNHFESKGNDGTRNLAGLSVGIYKNGRTAFFNRGFHESERRNVANRRPVT